jgi:NodT family efflux transporter outer membrane factor (OMF) lipoprotein
MPSHPRAKTVAAVLCAAALAGCALSPPDPAAAPPLPASWSAPLPHGGEAAQLGQWWSQFDDPDLRDLIDAAQREHGSLAQAAARIAEARANLRSSGGAAWPQLNAAASANRSKSLAVVPASLLSTTTSVGLDARWEIDLFGLTRNQVAAASARADAAVTSWHSARVSLAAEVAATFVGYRACEALVRVYDEDSRSQSRTAELTRLKVGAGFETPANGALATASAADAASRRAAQQAECDVLVKSLVALTAVDEPALRTRLTSRSAQVAQPAAFVVAEVPAQWLAQRPDLAGLEYEVAAASADIGAAQAERYPRLSLSGTIAAATLGFAGASTSGTNWSLGPALSLPLFDGGRRAANVDAARARYEQARAAYTQRVKDAVREVEEALVRLDAAARREGDARRAARGYREFFGAAQARWDIGVGSLLDLEDARRLALAADAGVINLQRERVASWIALYKAVGGGWDARAPHAWQVSGIEARP